MVPYLLVGLGGAIGSMMRHGISSLFAQNTFPLGTLLVNISGSFIIGLLAGCLEGGSGFFSSMELKLFLMIGVLGGFTTFSSFSIQTINLFEKGMWLYGIANIVISVTACLVLAAIGLKIGGRLV
jgi:CrcB protein